MWRANCTCFSLIVSALTIGGCNAQDNRDCIRIQNQGVDSLMAYNRRNQKKESTLMASLKLLDDAIQCDSTMLTARSSRITVLTSLGDFRKALDAIDEMMISSL